jgi:hypothetical protein
MSEKSFDLYSLERASGEKFDYYICGAAAALFAYIGQTYTPHILDSWFYFLTPVALLALTICFGIGLWSIAISKDITTLNKEILLRLEESTKILELLRTSNGDVFDSPKEPSKSRTELIAKVEANREIANEIHNDAMKKIENANK